MKNTRVIVTKVGGAEGLKVVEDEAPEPGFGEVRIEVKAAGVSHADVTIREGMYPKSFKPPFTLGYDIVGIVEKLGPGVNEFQVGDTVAALTVIGGYTRYLCWKADDLTLVPAGADYVKAVCLILNYVTAYQMLHRIAKVKTGERVLIHSAAGGVGSALIQLGSLAKLEMLGTASTSKLSLVERLGATPIDYTQEDFVRRVREITNDGVDAVFDAIGGANFTRSFRTLRKGGRFVGYGFTSKMGQRFIGRVDTFARLALMMLIPNNRSAAFYGIMFVKAAHPDWFKEDLEALLGLLMQGKIDPLVSAVLPLKEAPKAIEMLEKRQVNGKIILTP